MRKRPLIAVTQSSRQSWLPNFALKLAIWLAGGRVISINPASNQHRFDYQALLLGGGVDIDPKLYGDLRKIGYHYQFERDELELKHLAYAEQHHLPVFGICRGCQLMNVYRKGTLCLDIEKVFENAQYPSHLLGYLFFRKTIHIQKPSLLFAISKQHSLKVNSIHKQAIAKLGLNLKITAWERNQIIQAIEDPTKPFYFGVQFHPEFLIHKKIFLNLFRAFVKQASSKKQSEIPG
ncbi:gamma-glutamyl-gamma-aminobutyrate hydrolase family protein [Legionella jordanis]|uniref:Glutamine amidotransferase n=1 Tax=Legionella jordanis TaxID=456 RepID=A0A0W0VC14_9GAMM|nr:gamma-glutamyl-gamma-aminobutyrate hydrolase family protein [Legionella jordanis]KTD17675.1 glutamine amidotransferase [Legionella jordanis]RMX01547.1 gamma-glutamyl-gamma-aminobutyrate hydrolase family protein [Legionella jordanis]RMX21543.1 gamma-glutamyl-gamma-aminobutyrate hydrolase family protein [Legionella jordanis]VEH11396.1 glutamine amidotransferase [Legionella jordanis]